MSNLMHVIHNIELCHPSTCGKSKFAIFKTFKDLAINYCSTRTVKISACAVTVVGKHIIS